MSRSRCTDASASTAATPAVRRAVASALVAASVAGCGVKGDLELPPPEPFEEQPDALEDPETYGDPFTFPEPGEDEEMAE